MFLKRNNDTGGYVDEETGHLVESTVSDIHVSGITRVEAGGVLAVDLGRETGLRLKYVAGALDLPESALLDLIVDIALATIEAEKKRAAR